MQAEVYKDWTLAQCVDNIARIPNLFAKEIRADSMSEFIGLVNIYSRLQGLSLWLRNLVLAEPLPKAALEDWPYSQPDAELWKARLDLISALYPRSASLQETFLKTPAAVWFGCILAEARQQIISVFLCTEPGKRTVLRNRLQDLKALDEATLQGASFADAGKRLYEDLEADPFPQGKKVRITRLEVDMDAWVWIKLEAQDVASKDPDFDRDYFRPWVRTEKRFIGKQDRDPSIQFISTKDGKLGFTHKNGKRSKPKGFAQRRGEL